MSESCPWIPLCLHLFMGLVVSPVAKGCICGPAVPLLQMLTGLLSLSLCQPAFPFPASLRHCALAALAVRVQHRRQQHSCRRSGGVCGGAQEQQQTEGAQVSAVSIRVTSVSSCCMRRGHSQSRATVTVTMVCECAACHHGAGTHTGCWHSNYPPFSSPPSHFPPNAQ